MTHTTTPATAGRDATKTTPEEVHDMTDYYAQTLAIVAGLLPKVYRQRQPKTTSACHNYLKPKGPMLENIFGSEVASPTYKRAFVVSEFDRRAPARAGMVAGRMGHTARLAARRNPCFQHPAHPRSLKTARVVPESRSGVPTMTQAIATLACAAAPVIHLASRRAAPILSQADTSNPEVIALHAAAENALSMALSMLRNPGGTTTDLERATARACRAATLLKRACAAQANGGAA